jgi:hypothetical protein
MSGERTFRSLAALSDASTSRVLNLLAISKAHGDDAGFRNNPLFTSPKLNSAIIIKHRMRADEVDVFISPRAVGTKVIIPFENSDLRSGGRSLFVGQRGYESLLRELGNYGERNDVIHDMRVLALLDTLPSLDPFLLREQLRNHGLCPDRLYFQVPEADRNRMFQFASGEIRRLTDLAAGAGSQYSAVARMVEALLSDDVGEKLDPLRQTLQMEGAEFREGMFGWRGFLYYKWSLQEFWPDLIASLRQIKTVRPVGAVIPETQVQLGQMRHNIILGAKRSNDEVRRILGIYDAAYEHLISQHDAGRFRAFLLQAPGLFLEIGERIGALSHLTSFWKYRFPRGAPRTVGADELVAIFEDFAKGLAVRSDPVFSLNV